MLSTDELHLEIFEDFSLQEIKELKTVIHTREYDPGETVLFQNQPARDLYIVAQGEVEITHLPYDGPEWRVGRLNMPAQILAAQAVRDMAVKVGDTSMKSKASSLLSKLLSVRVYQASFVGQKNIGDIDVLLDIAREINLDAAALRQALESEKYLPLLLEHDQWCMEQKIEWVPTVLDGEKRVIEGAFTYAEFVAAMREKVLKRQD